MKHTHCYEVRVNGKYHCSVLYLPMAEQIKARIERDLDRDGFCNRPVTIHYSTDMRGYEAQEKACGRG